MSAAELDNFKPAYLKAAEELRKNPDQWKAYESKGNCVVLAGPGSGKTKLLTVKMARIIHEKIHPPQGIACITYSTECARELKRRLDYLGIEENRNIFIGTIHGFCLNQIIRPYAKIAGYPLPDPIKVVDTVTCNNIFRQAASDLGIEGNPIYLKTTFDRYRRTYIDRKSDEFKKSSAVMPGLIKYFESTLHKAGYVDFDDMMLIGLRLIERRSWVRKALKARFPFLVIDEYQDLGVPLHNIVMQLVFNAGIEVFAVGDPDQSIYGFTGAQPNLLRSLSECDGIEKIELGFNYRCGKKIVEDSIVTLGEKRRFKSVTDEDGELYFWKCPQGAQEQVDTICSDIIQFSLQNRKGRNLGDIAIIYLDKYDATRITRAAKKHGLNYIGGDRNIRYKFSPVTRWLEDCALWCSGGWKIGTPRLSSIIQFWLNIQNNTNSSLEENSLRQTIVSILWNNRDPKCSLSTWLQFFLDAGLQKRLEQTQTRTDEIESLSELIAAASDPDKMGDFNIGTFSKQRGSPDHVNLVTLHSSKGLEFDVVIMMGLEQGRIPDYRISEEDDRFKEERRKFYVGMTRARGEVHLVYSGWYENNWGKRFNNGPSQFVIELSREADFGVPYDPQ
jgi:DNA helicase II / ATP-dependent DNA helicase PcrA